MAFDETFDVTNPAELAQPFAYDLLKLKSFDQLIRNEDELHLLNILGRAVKTLGLKGDYLVEAGRAVDVPEQHNPSMGVSVFNIHNLTFEGEFKEHTIVKLDGPENGSRIRALCLAFSRVTLLPFFEKVSEDRLLCVPVFAVDDILRTD